MSSVLDSPVFAAVLTLALYVLSLRLQGRWRWANPLIVGSVLLVLCLRELHIPYAKYKVGGDWFTYLLGPATVALAVPMYKQSLLLRRSLGRLIAVIALGSMVGMVTAALTLWSMRSPRMLIASAIPKSVTTPIAVQVSQELGGSPAITIAMVLVSGVLGSVLGPVILRLARIRHEHATGAAIGTSSHAIGTASLMRQSEVLGSVSSLAMVLSGVVTSLLAMILAWIWK